MVRLKFRLLMVCQHAWESYFLRVTLNSLYSTTVGKDSSAIATLFFGKQKS
ncbi:hypothetical protein C4J94_0165 [Pseudomonas sp. R5-89-07]|nr:hypothetical protein C4J94_0165 [Pseudomonas sp. R5-89-07]